MMLHVLFESDWTRFSFFSDERALQSFDYPTRFFEYESGRWMEHLFHNTLTRIYKSSSAPQGVFYSVVGGKIAPLLENLERTTGLVPIRIRPETSNVEWTYQRPHDFSVRRMFALNAAAMLWPQENLFLLGLNDEPVIDVMQGATHLGGTPAPWLKDVLKNSFPQTSRLLRHRPLKKLSPEETCQDLHDEVLIGGALDRWQKILQEKFFAKAGVLRVTYGPDSEGVHLLPGISDVHRSDLEVVGCRNICLQQAKPQPKSTSKRG